MNKTAMITGATSGIGEACAHLLAQNNYNIIITGRRKDRLMELAEKLEQSEKAKVLSLVFDVRSNEQVKGVIASLPEEWQTIDVLINNAGLAAGMETIDEGHITNWDRMIDTNVKGLLYVTKAIVPFMKDRQTGHIVNIGSIAGKEVYPNGNVYCASKHAVDALSKGMRLDLLPHNIKVTNVAPGLVETEFSLVRFDWDEDKAHNVYKGMTPLKPEDIADCILFAITRPDHVLIGDMLLLPSAQASSTIVKRQ